jgi:hypothetical protein
MGGLTIMNEFDPSPFKGEVRRGMVFVSINATENHPHPGPPLEGEGA